MNAVLGTAGHIDHGKTSLVQALTGINCDRLDEEQRRGITIELGFAWLDLENGLRLGIVDVPGHEKFVKNMVAGASGIDCVLLAIAADDGVMPQTREHLDICVMLGIKKGIVALTKADAVESDWLEMVQDDVRESLAGTFLENAPIIPVSAYTGQGIAELRHAISQLVSSLAREDATDIFRLPVDRVFTLKGIGTVITGTIVSGQCRRGETLCIMPENRQGIARSLQTHGITVEEARQGQRCAINFQGLDVEQISKGDIITTPNSLFPSDAWLVKLTCLAGVQTVIRQRTEVHFHHFSKECSAKIILYDRDELRPGQSALAELHFDQPQCGIFGDHFVLRSGSPLRAIGGGYILDPVPAKMRQRDPGFSERKILLSSFINEQQNSSWSPATREPAQLARLALALSGISGANEQLLLVRTGLSKTLLGSALQSLEKSGEIINLDPGTGYWTTKAAIAQILASLQERAEELHKREPLLASFPATALFSIYENILAPKYLQKMLDTGIKQGLFVNEGAGVRLSSWQISLDAEQADQIARILALYEKGQYAPPLLKEVQEKTGIAPKSLLALMTHLCQRKDLVKIADNLYFHRLAFDNIVEQIRQWFNTRETITVADMKTMFNISRKFAIPLLEYMDGIRLTYRSGDARKLRRL